MFRLINPVSTEGGEVPVEDLRSKNGTFVGGKLVTSASVPRNGDEIRVGPVVFDVLCCGAARQATEAMA